VPRSRGPVELNEWSAEELLQTARESYGLGADAEMPNEVRFQREVVRLIRKRIIRSGVATGDPAVFFLAPHGPSDSEASELKSFPMLDNGLTPVEGRFWFVGPVVRSGRALDLPSLTDDELFAYAEELGVGGAPAIFFDTRTDAPSARFYARGLASPDFCTDLRIADTPPDVDEIFAAIDRIHGRFLATPKEQLGRGRLWEKPRKRWVASDAEATIGLYLVAGLFREFPGCVVRPEIEGVTGRVDLEIQEVDLFAPSTITHHAILELKVIRTYGSTGTPYSADEMRKWIREGVIQAASYRDERHASLAALCCFDMRSPPGEKCFTHVGSLAKRRKVDLEVWLVFATAKEMREVLNEAA
jgi:hypothetical protein